MGVLKTEKFHLEKSLRAQNKAGRTKLFLVCQNKNILGSPNSYRYLGGKKIPHQHNKKNHPKCFHFP